jgi:hypothetical protein
MISQSDRGPLEISGSRGDDWLSLPDLYQKALVLGDPALGPLFTRLRAETDAGCALIAASHLSNVLIGLIQTAMVPLSKNQTKDLFGVDRPLATFSSRIRIAAALGLIAADEHGDLNRIRAIRNLFAHEIEQPEADPGSPLSFQSPEVEKHVSQLSLPKVFYDHPTLVINRDTPRDRFEIAVGIASLLMDSARKTSITQRMQKEGLSELLLPQYKAYRQRLKGG